MERVKFDIPAFILTIRTAGHLHELMDECSVDNMLKVAQWPNVLHLSSKEADCGNQAEALSSLSLHSYARTMVEWGIRSEAVMQQDFKDGK